MSVLSPGGPRSKSLGSLNNTRLMHRWERGLLWQRLPSSIRAVSGARPYHKYHPQHHSCQVSICFVESPDEISRTLELCPFNKCSRTTSRDVGMYLGDDPTHTSRPEIATIAHLLVPYRHRKSLNLHAILLEGLTFAAADERFGCLGRTK